MTKTALKKISLLSLVLFLYSCGSPALFPELAEPFSPSLSENAPAAASTPVTLESIEFKTATLTLEAGQVAKPQLLARLSNGSVYKNISGFLLSPYKKINFEVIWFSNNEAIATVDATGRVTAHAPGTTSIKVSIGKLAQSLELIVSEPPQAIDLPVTETDPESDEGSTPAESHPTDIVAEEDQDNTQDTEAEVQEEEPEETVAAEEETPDTPEVYKAEPPSDPSESFLNANDSITLSVGEHGGYNSQNLPDVVLGIPDASRADVVSLGTNGEILIELHGYLIVDGLGPDFVVFENPFSGWTERAQVSVSEDGENFLAFDCDAFDPQQIYAGCAGATIVNYSDDPENYLDPDSAGGDSFDLADLGLSLVRFVKITDMATCTSPVLCNFGKAGFDLDAMAIVNGVEEIQ